MSELSLRERTRARRRQAIADAAAELFAERGYDGTTLADVAELAEVAPRTVSMYFPSKLHLALAHTSDATQRLADTLGGRDGGVRALDLLLRWVDAEFEQHGERMTRTAEVFRRNPEIRGAATPELVRLKAAVTAALAADLGRPPDDVAVAMAAGAIEGILDTLVRAGRTDGLPTAKRMLGAVLRAAST